MGNIMIMHKGKLIDPPQINPKAGEVYYYGANIPASVVYVTRTDDRGVYYLKLEDTLYHTKADSERFDSFGNFSASVYPGEAKCANN